MTSESELKKAIGQQLQRLRLQRKLTQEQMGEKLNLSTSAYCKIEYGETDLTLTRLNKIAEVLEMPITELFKTIFEYASSTQKETIEDLRELVKANAKLVDLLCKRIDLLEQRML